MAQSHQAQGDSLGATEDSAAGASSEAGNTDRESPSMEHASIGGATATTADASATVAARENDPLTLPTVPPFPATPPQQDPPQYPKSTAVWGLTGAETGASWADLLGEHNLAPESRAPTPQPQALQRLADELSWSPTGADAAMMKELRAIGAQLSEEDKRTFFD